jgi:hypothetical protein
MLRFIVNSILILSVFIFPWWVSGLLGLCALFYFHTFYEIVVLGLIIDSLYNAKVPHFLEFQFVVTIASILVLCISLYIKERIRFYQ